MNANEAGDLSIEEAINFEREQCALACEAALSFDPDDPGATYAAIIRSRSAPPNGE